MNQILSVDSSSNKKEKKQRKSNGPVEIKTVLKFFAIALLIFGIFTISSGTYAIYKENEKRENTITKPTIVEENKDENTVLLKIMHDKAIQKVEYYWNDEEAETISGNGRKYIEQEITIPDGVNTLYVKATDVEGQEISYSKEYEKEEVIKLEVIDGKLRITADNETEISYLTYRWNDNDETRIDVNSVEVDTQIDIPKGQNSLIVVLVDVNNETITKEQEIKGVNKPTVEVTLDDSQEHFVIKAVDENALDRIAFRITNSKYPDGKTYKVTAKNGEKELEVEIELETGENKIDVVTYNADGVDSELVTKKITK